MHKTNEGIQVQTALEKAEKRLADAIKLAKYASDGKESESRVANKAVEDAMCEFKKAAMEEHRNSDVVKNKVEMQYLDNELEDFNDNEIKSGITEKMDQTTFSVDNLCENFTKETEDSLTIDKNMLNEEFHDGYDSLNKMATFKKALRELSNQSPEGAMLSESEEYEMKCFNEKNTFDGQGCEPNDIMPRNFFFHSFDDEDEGKVKPYGINEALILGDPDPSNDFSEKIEDDLATPDMPIEEEKEDSDLKKQELLQQIQKEAEETLQKSKSQAKIIIEKAHEEAKKIIDEKVQQAMDEASKKGYDEGFKKGEGEGYFAAENAVNDGMIQEAANFRGKLEASIEEFEIRKSEILDNNINELADLAINVAEKVIKISLKSSKDVVAKMIVAAAEDCRNKEWAKVYISHEDKVIAMNLEKGLIDVLNQISANVKVVVMEDEPSGTCIIESPDQIVDASVGPQLDNIRQIVSDNKI